ncbi:MAG: methylated-DNA--[Firmicutes bacterium]|nr:methylated-DNA--[protein]-cysteine S-methyltransferase [Bacillota bacterium]
MNSIQYYDSPLGRILIASDGTAVTGLWFEGQKYYAEGLAPDCTEQDVPVFREVRRWLDLYFSGRDPGFTPPLSLDATPFRKEVWDILLMIPYGETKTYGEIASQIAARKGLSGMSAQAVGGAVGHNPVSLIVPCHRVVGAGGSLTGYAGGLERKQALLDLEKRGSAAPVLTVAAKTAEDDAFDVFEEMCRDLHGLNDE